MKSLSIRALGALLVVLIALPSYARPQTTAAPSGQPGRSKSETIAILYIKTLVNAQREYKKKRGEYAASLAALVNHGSFTKRMSRPDRGDYEVKFSGNGKGFWVVLNPKEFDQERRSFYSDSSGNIRAQENEPASADSPLL